MAVFLCVIYVDSIASVGCSSIQMEAPFDDCGSVCTVQYFSYQTRRKYGCKVHDLFLHNGDELPAIPDSTLFLGSTLGSSSLATSPPFLHFCSVINHRFYNRDYIGILRLKQLQSRLGSQQW